MNNTNYKIAYLCRIYTFGGTRQVTILSKTYKGLSDDGIVRKAAKLCGVKKSQITAVKVLEKIFDYEHKNLQELNNGN